MSNWTIKVRVTHATYSLSLISFLKTYEFSLKLGTIDPLHYNGQSSHTPPSRAALSHIGCADDSIIPPVSRALSPVFQTEPTVKVRKRRAEHGQPSVYHRKKRNKFEPKVKVPRTGEKTTTDVWLGDYPSHLEAANVYWIGAYYYNQHKRFSNDVISWCKDNLPDISRQANLSTEEEKASWIRNQAEYYRFALPHPSSLSVEHRGGGLAVPVEDGGSQSLLRASPPVPSEDAVPLNSSAHIFMADSSTFSMDIAELTAVVESDFLQEAIWEGDLYPGADLNRIGQEQHFEDLSVDNTNDGYSGDQGAGSHQQGVQHLQQNHGTVTDLEDTGAGTNIGSLLQRDESEDHHALRVSANHPQAVDLVSQELKELKCTDAIQFLLQDLIERDWDFEIQPRASTETFSVPFPSLCEGPMLTRANYLAFREIYKQGFKVIVKPPTEAPIQDGNGRPQSRTPVSVEPGMWRPQSELGSRDLCRSCNARLFAE